VLRAVFFDFDGLIVDTETPEVDVWREVFQAHGTTFPDAYWMHAIGRGADAIKETPVQLLARSCTQQIDAEAVRREHHREVMRRIDAQPPRPGIVPLLEALRDASIPTGVVSSSRHAWVDGHLARLGLAHLFQTTTCADDVARAKPFPDLYLLACERFGVSPAEALTFEDSPNGIAAARAAGVTVVCYPNPLTRQMDVSAADRRVETLEGVSLADLQSWVRSAA
jgi:HAD superfamily hydrolase (TIGR01509 family)